MWSPMQLICIKDLLASDPEDPPSPRGNIEDDEERRGKYLTVAFYLAFFSPLRTREADEIS